MKLLRWIFGFAAFIFLMGAFLVSIASGFGIASFTRDHAAALLGGAFIFTGIGIAFGLGESGSSSKILRWVYALVFIFLGALVSYLSLLNMKFTF
jgi:hypothetical protein